MDPKFHRYIHHTILIVINYGLRILESPQEALSPKQTKNEWDGQWIEVRGGQDGEMVDGG